MKMWVSILRLRSGQVFALSIFIALILAARTFAAPESDSEVAARKAALDLAGAFSNEGFKMRDGHWSGTINARQDRKSTRLNSSHVAISYAVFCLKKKKRQRVQMRVVRDRT